MRPMRFPCVMCGEFFEITDVGLGAGLCLSCGGIVAGVALSADRLSAAVRAARSLQRRGVTDARTAILTIARRGYPLDRDPLAQRARWIDGGTVPALNLYVAECEVCVVRGLPGRKIYPRYLDGCATCRTGWWAR